MSTEGPVPAAAAAPIVVGVDGSDSSTGALKLAGELAAALGSRVLAVSIWHYPPGYSNFGPIGWRPETEARESLQRAVGAVFGPAKPDHVETAVMEGPPARTLIEASRDAAMLVVGSRGHGGFAGLMLGSVSSACAQHAHCPVLVYHQPR